MQKALEKLNGLRNTTDQEKIYRIIEEVTQQKNKKFRHRILIKKGQKLISVNIEAAGFFFTQNTVTFLVTKDKQK